MTLLKIINDYKIIIIYFLSLEILLIFLGTGSILWKCLNTPLSSWWSFIINFDPPDSCWWWKFLCDPWNSRREDPRRRSTKRIPTEICWWPQPACRRPGNPGNGKESSFLDQERQIEREREKEGGREGRERREKRGREGGRGRGNQGKKRPSIFGGIIRKTEQFQLSLNSVIL